ncbi:MarR family winged helix-turn-helix transcriptional regulator [Candidatus Contubernalis alkaliaceticus]|uniref:MarR family winged helix-turn-helix transcriptional regulator n=1 Tax=Candidatus Contubernalis alkaliaceticus TaxID=338645 RepID=UPI001F4BD7EA|nr:MarR family transcriptional regulator [Candidatus Contubernalis alkalaceticus]UNC93105.1 MarR family transcriptional regulator [Candidatus Contubernalis alkalaceticus]
MKDLEQLTDELLCFFNGFASWESSVIRSSDLTVSEAHAIEILGQYGKMNMKQLSQKLGVTTGTTTVTVDRLETRGYARRESIKEDRRVNLISLTDKGTKAFEEHHRYHLSLTEQMISTLSDEESSLLLDMLKKINREVF